MSDFRNPNNFSTPKSRPDQGSVTSKTPNRFSSKEEEQNYNIDVLCINCQQMINVDEIDQHSMACFKVNEKVYQIENNLTLNQIDYKLSKLQEALEQHSRSKQTGYFDRNSIGETQTSRQITDFINRILKFNNKADAKQIKMLKDVIVEIQQTLTNFKGSTALLLYLERVKLMGKEKYRELVKKDQETFLNWKDTLNFANKDSNPLNSTADSTQSSTKSVNQSQDRYNRFKSAPEDSNQQYQDQNRQTFASSNFVQPSQQQTQQQARPSSQQSSNPYSVYSSNNPGQKYTLSHLYSGNTTLMDQYSSQGGVQRKKYMSEMPERKFDEQNPQQPKSSIGYKQEITRIDSDKPFITFSNQDQRQESVPSGSGSPFQYQNYYQNYQQGFNSQYNSNQKTSPNEQRFENVTTQSAETSAFGGTESVKRSYNAYSQPQSFNNPSTTSLSQKQTDDSPYGYLKYFDNKQERSRSKDAVKQELENKLENKRKELSELNKMVDVYKKKTETIQNTINTQFSSTPSTPSQSNDPYSPQKRSVQSTQRNEEEFEKYSQDGDFEDFQQNMNKYIKVKNNYIDDVDSEIHHGMSSKYSESQETSSNLDKTSYRDSRLAEMNELDELAQKAKQNETQEEQRVFYSKCLAIKMKLKSNEHSQYIPVAFIYRDAREQNIPKSNWDAFIEDAFRNPQKYIDVSKIKHKKRHGLKNKLTEIAQHKQVTKKKVDLLTPIDVIYE